MMTNAIGQGSQWGIGCGGVIDESMSAFSDEPLAPSDDRSARLVFMGTSRFAESSPLKAVSSFSSGGGGASGGGPGSIFGDRGSNGGDGSRGPKSRISANSILIVLQQLNERRVPSLTKEVFGYLEARRFIDRLAETEYNKQERSVMRLSLMENDLKAARQKHKELEDSHAKLLKTHDSFWHEFSSRITHFSRRGLDKEAEELQKMEATLTVLSREIAYMHREQKGFRLAEAYLKSFTKTRYGYMRLSRAGEQMLSQLNVFSSSIQGISMSEFEARIEKLKATDR